MLYRTFSASAATAGVGVSTVAATTEAADAAKLGGAGIAAEMGMAAAVGVSFVEAMGVLSTSMGKGMTSIANPD